MAEIVKTKCDVSPPFMKNIFMERPTRMKQPLYFWTTNSMLEVGKVVNATVSSAKRLLKDSLPLEPFSVL